MEPYNRAIALEVLAASSNRALLKSYRQTVTLIAELTEMKAKKQRYYLGDPVYKWLFNERCEIKDIKAELLKRGYVIEKIKL